LKKLDHGKTSKIYLGKDCDQFDDVVITVFHFDIKPNPSVKSQAFREIRILQQMIHPNIIKMKEVLFSEETKSIYIIMEFGTLGSLDRILKKNKTISEKNAAIIFKQIAKGLNYLHSNGFIHQDIKPSNILLTRDGKAKLSDFGVGRSFGSSNCLFGSPSYQAPEILDYELSDGVGAKEDIWSLGVSLFEAIFGYLPFQGEDMYQICSMSKKQNLPFP
jgi:serine/threonine-protein kinase 11